MQSVCVDEFGKSQLMIFFGQHQAVKDYDLSHIRFAMFGAAPMSSEINQQLLQVLPNASIGQGYGQRLSFLY